MFYFNNWKASKPNIFICNSLLADTDIFRDANTYFLFDFLHNVSTPVLLSVSTLLFCHISVIFDLCSLVPQDNMVFNKSLEENHVFQAFNLIVRKKEFNLMEDL